MLPSRVETKQALVRLVLEEHLTYVEVASRMAIRKSERIEVWVRKYRQEGEPSFHKPIGRLPHRKPNKGNWNALLKSGECGSHGAISGNLLLQKRIRSESHVRIQQIPICEKD